MHLKVYFSLLVFICYGNSSHGINIEFNLLLNDLIVSLEKIINFYSNNLPYFNLDGIFGLKILQGELTNVLTNIDINLLQLFLKIGDLDKHLFQDKSFITRLNDLRAASQNLSSKAITYIQKDDFKYYQRMKYFVENEWKPLIVYRKVNKQIIPIKGNESLFGESLSDECLSTITKYTNDDSSQICNISDDCRNALLLQKGLKGYLVTHQVLYTTIIQKSSCLKYVNKILQINHTSIVELQNEFCSQIFLERRQVFPDNISGNSFYDIIEILPEVQDLLLEQVFVCGSIGFMEFVDLKLLRTIMNWISPNGCFKLSFAAKNKTEFGRAILEEAYLNGGCLAHKTSLGLAALSLYLRLFFDRSVNYYFKLKYNIVKILPEERLQFERRNNPSIINNHLSLSEIISILNTVTSQWIPYFNKTTSKSLNIIPSWSYNFYIFYFIIFIVIVFLLLKRRFNNCISCLINRMKI